MEKRRMCPNCRAFVSTDDRVCPYCDAKLGPSAVEKRGGTSIAGLMPAARFVTSILLLINIGIYAAAMLATIRSTGATLPMDIDMNTLAAFGAKARFFVFSGEYWRLVTAGFIHGGAIHILMNCWILFDVGPQVEENFGASRFVVIYFLATVCGFLASTFFNDALSVGASAGIFGLLGAMIALGRRSNSAAASAIRSHYTQWVLYMLVIGLLPFFRIDMAAHIGGLVAGFGVATLAGTPYLIDDWREKVWHAGAIACVLLTAVSFGFMFLQLASVG